MSVSMPNKDLQQKLDVKCHHHASNNKLMPPNAAQLQIMQQTSGEVAAGICGGDTIRTQEDYHMKSMALDKHVTNTILIPEDDEHIVASQNMQLNGSIDSNEYQRRGTAFVEGMEDEQEMIQVGSKVVKKPILGSVAVSGGKKGL